ncbi:MAG: hypothetical protein MJD61_02475, partial [Proteobacteria bacterium]|nr:hypothetical protein [Pseudomonadota bacterium]
GAQCGSAARWDLCGGRAEPSELRPVPYRDVRPQDSVGGSKLRTLACPLVDSQLLTQGEILGDQGPRALQGGPNGVQQRQQQCHGRVLAPGGNLSHFTADDVFADNAPKPDDDGYYISTRLAGDWALNANTRLEGRVFARVGCGGPQRDFFNTDGVEIRVRLEKAA